MLNLLMIKPRKTILLPNLLYVKKDNSLIFSNNQSTIELPYDSDFSKDHY